MKTKSKEIAQEIFIEIEEIRNKNYIDIYIKWDKFQQLKQKFGVR